MTVEYEAFNKSDNSLVIKAKTKHCFTKTNLHPANLKKAFPRGYEILTNCIEK
jgi:hypothetical protein